MKVLSHFLQCLCFSQILNNIFLDPNYIIEFNSTAICIICYLSRYQAVAWVNRNPTFSYVLTRLPILIKTDVAVSAKAGDSCLSVLAVGARQDRVRRLYPRVVRLYNLTFFFPKHHSNL
jgi:hypothetical protein